MSVLIVCFSCVTAFADTTVDGSDHLKFLKDNVINLNVDSIHDFNLSKLPGGNYLTFLNKTYASSGSYNLSFVFIPQSSKKIVYLGSDLISDSDMQDDTIYIYHVHNGSYEYIKVKSLSPIYSLQYSATGNCWFKVYDPKIEVSLFSNNSGNYYSGASDMLLVNNQYLSECFDKIDNIDFAHVNMSYRNVSLFSFTDLFANIVKIVPGYTGSVIDNSLDAILSKYAKDCDNSILKQYKYQITYLQNNDIKMMFLNNNKAPNHQITVFDGLYENACKYKFTYQNTYDAVIYFPQYQKYLTYDDWYNNKTESNEFKWFWEKDDKSFSLISDWTVSKSESGVSYSGTRVVLSWDNTNSSAKASLTKPWNVDTDNLKEKGWKEGRPTDQNYPYCVDYYINSAPCFSVYFNAKPRVEVDRLNTKQCTYKIQMVTQCGYVYSHFANMYFKFDYTTKINDEKNILEKAQNSFWVWFNEYGAEMDDKCKLHLYENYKGDDNFYIGYRVFFNWDITTNWGNSNPDDDFDYSSIVRDGSKFVDSDGHLHGGSLGNYDNEDLNKYNDNGSGSSSGCSEEFDFSFNCIKSYCSDFFSFLQAIFGVFPFFVWFLVGSSLSVLIALRILSR